METIILVITEFTEELLWAEISLLGFFLAIYLLCLLKRTDGEPSRWIPDQIVRNYLDSVRNGERAMRQELFFEDMKKNPGDDSTVDSLQGEVGALRAQLATADSRLEEKETMITDLKENKDSDASEGELHQKIKDLEVRLQEYSVIENELAELKKYQSENKELKEKLGKGKVDTGAKKEDLVSEFEKMLAS